MPTDIISPPADVVDDAALAQLLNPHRSFPPKQLVDAAAALFGPVLPRGLMQGRHSDGRDFLLSVSAGTVGVRMTDADRRERTLAAMRVSRDAQAVKVDPSRPAVASAEAFGLITLPAALQVDPLTGLFYAEALFDKETGRPAVAFVKPTRVITEWSRKSRSNMTRMLSELDYEPLFVTGRTPAMLTLTYPGDWEPVAPSGKAVKRHVRLLWRRWGRAWGAAPAALWKMEFQRRGAPHFHIFAVPEVGTTACSCCGQMLEFRYWLSHQWADIVAADDQVADEFGNTERRRHQLAGTGIDYKEGSRMRDPKRLAVYFTKHGGAAGGKEYQHVVPPLWRTADNGPGRFWGVVGLVRHRREAYVNEQTYITLRRTMRRWSKAQRRTRTMRRQTVSLSTGQVRSGRQTTRRYVQLDHGGLAGGWLALNDGPVFAAALHRLAEPPPPVTPRPLP